MKKIHLTHAPQVSHSAVVVAAYAQHVLTQQAKENLSRYVNNVSEETV